jgi:hypothetical protein
MVCVTLAAVAHWLGNGSGVRPPVVLGGGAVVLAATFVLAGRERSPLLIGGFLVTAQVFLHELFAVSAMPGPALGHLMHGRGLSAGLGMIIAHLTATLMTAWWLARGEAALWTVLRGVVALLDRRLPRLLAPAPGPVAPARSSAAIPRRTPGRARPVLRHSVIRRGPPPLHAH